MVEKIRLPKLEPGLIEAFKDLNNPPVLFVGSGVSCAAGLDSWDKIIAKMKDILNSGKTSRKKKEDFSGLSYLDIAEYFRIKLGDNVYFRFLRKQFRDTPFKLKELHETIADLPVKTIITTNYDKILECTFRNKWSVDPVVIVYGKQLQWFDLNQEVIIKLHGDIDHPDSIILTSSDYSKFDNHKNELCDHIKNVLSSSTVLIIGFGLRDPNFQDQFWHMKGLFPEKNLAIFALVDRLNRAMEQIWSNWGITVIQAKSRMGVIQYLKKLRTSIK